MQDSIETRPNNRIFALTLTFLFASWVFFVSAHHKPWRDEADVWLAARDMSMGQLFHWLAGAGSPGLWYLLLMPFAKLGLPYESMMFVHSAIAIAGAALIAFLSPFPRTFKTLLVFSYFLSYEYAVVARSYVLTCLLLFLIAAVLTANVRRYWLLGILLFLLFNTNVHGFFLAGIIGAVVTVQAIMRGELRRSTWVGMAIAIAGAGLALTQLSYTAQAHTLNPGRRWPVVGYSIAEAFLPHIPHYSAYDLRAVRDHRWVIYLAFIGTRAAGALVAISALYLMRRAFAAIAIVVLAWVAMQYIGVFKWYGNERHAGLFFIMIVFGLWVVKFSGGNDRSAERPVVGGAGRASYAVLMTSLFVSCATAAVWSYHEIRWDYSGAQEAATFLNDPALAALPIAAGAGEQAESILPFLPGKQLWFSGRQEFATYTVWDRDWLAEDSVSQDQLLARIRLKFAVQPHLLLLPIHPLRDPKSAGYRLVFKNAHYVFGHKDEIYFIYASTGTDSVARVE